MIRAFGKKTIRILNQVYLQDFLRDLELTKSLDRIFSRGGVPGVWVGCPSTQNPRLKSKNEPLSYEECLF